MILSRIEYKTCSMETTSKKNALFLAALIIGIIFLAGFASPTQLGLVNAQQNALMQSQVGNLYD
jgi:hypothetical protein